MTKQFTKGNPVWYVNKRTKKVYAGVYLNYSAMGFHNVYIGGYWVYSAVEDDCLFVTKFEAHKALEQYLADQLGSMDVRIDKLKRALEDSLRSNVQPTEKENQAYKRLYARYINWTGERS